MSNYEEKVQALINQGFGPFHAKIHVLEREGIVRELCPEPNDHGGVLYWHYHVLRPDDMPEAMVQDIEEEGYTYNAEECHIIWR